MAWISGCGLRAFGLLVSGGADYVDGGFVGGRFGERFGGLDRDALADGGDDFRVVGGEAQPLRATLSQPHHRWHGWIGVDLGIDVPTGLRGARAGWDFTIRG